MTQTEPKDLRAALTEAFDRLPAEGALATRRKGAFALFQQMEPPTLKHEEWKYTSVRRLLDGELALPDGEATLTDDEYDSLRLDLPDARHFFFVNGRLTHADAAPEGVSVADLADAPAEARDRVGTLLPSEADYFTALNTAFAHHGAYVSVAGGQVAETPVVLYLVTDARRGATLSQPRHLIVAEPNSQARFVVVHRTLGEQPALTNTVTEGFIGKDAVVDFYQIQDETTTARHINTLQVEQADGSTFYSGTVSLRADMVRNNQNLKLGEHCNGHLYGLYLLDGRTHVDNHTLVDHAAPNSFSDELFKGVLDDQSTGVFNGKVYVRQIAQKTNAFQSNRNILLSPDATVNTKPQLEIFADDVKCTHGATTGQLDEEALFYLQARGIGRAQARALLMHAFANEVIEKVRIAPLREHLEALITDRLLGE